MKTAISCLFQVQKRNFLAFSCAFLLGACGAKPSDTAPTAAPTGPQCANDGRLVYESPVVFGDPNAYQLTLNGCSVTVLRNDGCTLTGTRGDRNPDTGEYFATITAATGCGNDVVTTPSQCSGHREDNGNTVHLACLDLGISVYMGRTE